MPSSKDYLTTQAFAQKIGVSASTVSKWLRKKKISGQKKNGKWMIPVAELSKIDAPKAKPVSRPTEAPSKPDVKTHVAKTGDNHYTIEEFSAMTYLTEFGVKKWLKEGRLIAAQDASGNTLVASSNVEQPYIKRLMR